MTILLFIVIFVLICIILFQYKLQNKRTKNLQYIQSKLQKIILHGADEKLLVVTDENELKGLLVEINNLLDYNQKILSDYRKKEIAMRKMLSNISHDLKTPLTVVLGYIETIKLDKAIENKEKDILLSKVHDKTLEIIELMNKFFDLAKLESGDKDIGITRINMNEVCRKNILDFYEILNTKGFKVNIDIPQVNIYALGNIEALDRIMSNLISNAIKYGSDGKVIGLNLNCDDDFTYVEIWDRGKGIDENEIDKVFERMYTLEDSRNSSFQGSGLGLTITKRLVEKMGGKILLNSKPNEKTSFIIKLKRLTY